MEFIYEPELLKYMKENGLKPKYRTLLAFTFGEEILFGACYVPDEVKEYVALDIGLVGPDYDALYGEVRLEEYGQLLM